GDVAAVEAGSDEPGSYRDESDLFAGGPSAVATVPPADSAGLSVGGLARVDVALDGLGPGVARAAGARARAIDEAEWAERRGLRCGIRVAGGRACADGESERSREAQS